MRTHFKGLMLPMVALIVAAVAMLASAPFIANAQPTDPGTLAFPLLGSLMPVVIPSKPHAVNDLGNYNETFFAQEALIQLEKVLGMAGRIHRGYQPDPQTQGDTIQIRKPSTFVAQDAPSTAQNIETEKTSVVLDKWKEVKFELTDKELSLTSDRIISDHIRPAAVALADQIDQDLASLYRSVPWYSTLSATPTLKDIAKLRKVMFENKVPLTSGNLHYMIDGGTELEYLSALAASGMQPNQQDSSLREGSMGRLFGFDTWANQNTPIHTGSGIADGVGAANGVQAKGASTLSLTGLSLSTTIKAGAIVVITGSAQQHVVTADTATDGAGAVAALPIYPKLPAAVAGATVVTIIDPAGAKAQTLAFHSHFACLATAPLSDLSSQLGAKVATISDPITNLSLRSRIFYEGNNSKVFVALDVLYGFKILNGNLAVRGPAA